MSKKELWENLTLKDLLPENMKKVREKILQSRTSDKLSNKNPLKNIICNMEYKTTKRIFYKTVCLIFCFYIAFLQTKAFVESNPAAWGMLLCTSVFLFWMTVNWSKPIFQNRSLAWSLPPLEVRKIIKHADTGSQEDKSLKRRCYKIMLARALIIFLALAPLFAMLAIKSYNENLLKFNLSGNFWLKLKSDFFNLSPFSSNILLNYLFLTITLCLFLLLFSNIFYAYERLIIGKKIEGNSLLTISFIPVIAVVIFLQMYEIKPEYMRYLLTVDNELFAFLFGGVVFFFFLMLAATTFWLIRKLALLLN